MDLILVVGVVWLILVVCALALVRAAALGDRADERRGTGHADDLDARRRARRARHGGHSGRAAVLAAAIPLAGAAAGASAPDAIAQGCPGARSAPGQSGPEVTLCVINAERRSGGLAALAPNVRLARAARSHSADMVARGYFAHTSPGGGTLAARLRRVGYARGCAWAAGETLAWGSGLWVTPRSRVAAWMRSRPHRAILLDPAYREAGIGIVPGAPEGSANAFTYTAEFGRRRC